MSILYPKIVNRVDNNNTTFIPLGISSVFTGSSTDITGYTSISMSIKTSNDSAIDGLSLQKSQDSVNWSTIKNYTVISNTPQFHIHNVTERYFRIVYTNGNVAQTYMRLQTILQVKQQNNYKTLNDGIDNKNNESVISKQVIPYKIDSVNNLNIRINNPKSSFGDIRIDKLTPVTQVNFTYGIISTQVKSTIIGSGTVNPSGGLALLSTGVNTNSSANLITREYLKQRPCEGSISRFSVYFTSGVSGSSQIAGIGNSEDGFFFGYNGATFGILYRTNVTGTIVDTWIPQSSWNIDKLNGTTYSGLTLNPTKGNCYQIVYGSSGFGNTTFFVYSSELGEFIPLHSIKNSNSSTTQILRNNHFPFYYNVINTTNTTNLTLGIVSMGHFVDGIRRLVNAPVYSLEYLDSVSKNNFTNTITLKNALTFNGITNNTPVMLTYICLSKPTNNNVVFLEVRLNAAVSGTPVFTNIDLNNSVVSYDVDGTDVTGGTTLLALANGSSSSTNINLINYRILFYPGDTLTLTCSANNNTTAKMSVCWYEDI